MTLKEKIIEHKTFALRNGDKEMRLVLSTLLGELDTLAKNPTDAQVVSTVKKMIENNKITNTEEENEYLERYLPVQMSDEELETRISFYIGRLESPTIRNMKDVMHFLSENYAGQYDGNKAAVYAKNLLMV